MNTQTKVCKHCGKEKPLSEYYKNKAMADGHQLWCKDCMNNYKEREQRKKAQEETIFPTPLAERYGELCDEYIKAFCEKQGLPYEHYWSIGDAGGVIEINEYYFDFDDIRYDIDHNIDTEEIFKWYDYVLLLAHHELPKTINYPSWCKGAPLPYSKELIDEIEYFQREINQKVKELEEFKRGL